MPETPLSLKNARLGFGLFSLGHFLLWSIAPFVVRSSLPFDTLESMAWGAQWQLGYLKHPPLSAWVSAIFMQLFGVGYAQYALAQIAILVMFWAMWRLAQKFVSPGAALVSVMVLEGVLFFSLYSPKFNVTSLMVPVWALSMLVFYCCLTEKKPWQWIVFGILNAANILTKYQAGIIFIPFLAVLLLTQSGREAFKKAWVYVSLFITLILLVPHFVWAYHAHFPEINYALHSTTDSSRMLTGWLAHLYYPARIIGDQVGMLIGVFLMSLPLWWHRSKTIITNRDNPTKNTLSCFDTAFLWIIGMGPFVLTILFALVTGSYLDANWCTPYFCMIGILLVVYLRPHVTKAAFKKFLAVMVPLSILIIAVRYGALLANPYLKHKAHAYAYRPNPEIAKRITQIWHHKYHSRLQYVGANHYLAAAIFVYSKDHPTPYLDWNRQESPWVNVAAMKKTGAMFAWRQKDAARLVPILKKHYKTLIFLPSEKFALQSKAHLPKAVIGLAILPPQKRIAS